MMGEAQAKCGIEQSDDLLLHFWKRQRAVLRRADRISTTGQKQMYAVIGELDSLGRLGYRNSAHSFCSVMPEAADSMFLEVTQPVAEKRYRGSLFPDDTFAVLWSGGYNTWTDVHALAASLTLAMEQVPRLRFVSTGGAIPGHNEGTYPEFINLMKRSGFEDRCHFLGWIEGSEIPQLYAECDLGLNIDGLNYETLLGGRNRLTSMMAAGLPILTTIGTEFSEIIADNRLGYTVRLGNIQEYADAMIRASKISPERRQLGQRARAYLKEHYLPSIVTKPLQRWAANPTMAPDNLAKLEAHPEARRLSDIALNPLEAEALALEKGLVDENTHLRNELARLESENAQLRGSRLFKLREQLHKVRKPR